MPLNDIRRRLISLSSQLGLIASELSTLPNEQGGEGSVKPDLSSDSFLWGQMATHFYAERRRREKFFSGDLFGEPAWDILLDLFQATKRNELVSVTDACIGAAVPPTTALRWIQTLEDHGMIERRRDESDNRRVHLCLTIEAYEKMVHFFAENRSELIREDVQLHLHKRSLGASRADSKPDNSDYVILKPEA